MCRRKGSMDGPEEILLDLNELAEGHKFLGLGAYAVSDDANWLAYSLDHDRLPAVHAAGEGPPHRPALSVREDRARRLGGVGDRQQDAVLHDRGCGLEAVRQVLAARGRRRTQRPGLEEKDELFDLGGRPVARQEGAVRRVVREDVARDPLPAARTIPPAPFKVVVPREAGTRVRRRSLRRDSSTSPPTRARRTSRW